MRSRLLALASPMLALTLAACGADAGSSAATETGSSSRQPASSTTLTQDGTEGEMTADEATQTVRAWLEAARRADVPAMEAGLGAYSRRAAEQLGGLQGMASGLAEGMSAFLDAQHWVAEPVSDQQNAFLVVASGDITREGMSERAARSWLVHREGGKAVVETFAPSGPQVVAPPSGQGLARSEPVEVVLPAGTVFALADGDGATDWADVQEEDGDQVRVRVMPPGGWSGGEHVVAVAVTPQDGATSAPSGTSATDAVAKAWASVAVVFATV